MEYVCDLTDDYPGIGFGDDEYSGTVERRERIVRCRDCKYAEGDTRCTRFHEADQDGYGHYPADICPDGFCAWGEERED